MVLTEFQINQHDLDCTEWTNFHIIFTPNHSKYVLKKNYDFSIMYLKKKSNGLGRYNNNKYETHWKC